MVQLLLLLRDAQGLLACRNILGPTLLMTCCAASCCCGVSCPWKWAPGAMPNKANLSVYLQPRMTHDERDPFC